MSYEFAALVLRLVVGGLMIGHGTQKLFGWFGGYGFDGTRAWLGDQVRLRPATLWTALAGVSEAGGGLLLATGFLSPLGSLGIIAAMVMAIILVHWPRLWATENGLEYPLVILTVATAVAIAGPGAYSLDAALGIALPAPSTFLVGLVLVLIGVAVALATRTQAAGKIGAPAERPARAA